MGIQGNKSTEKAAEFCEEILSRLSVIPGVTSRKQFGGHGPVSRSKDVWDRVLKGRAIFQG